MEFKKKWATHFAKGKFDLNLFLLNTVSCVKFIVGFNAASKLKAVSHEKQNFPHKFDAQRMPPHATQALLQETWNVYLKSQQPAKNLPKKKIFKNGPIRISPDLWAGSSSHFNLY